MGRSFLSSSENGLYMSVILRPKIPAEECVNITVLGAVAVLEAIEELTNKQAQIKWVNDIYINDKKCCGILTEASIDVKSGGLNYAIIGIGVNLCPPKGGFDKEIQDIACGVYEDTCPSDFKYKLCAQIVNKLFKYYDSIQSKSYLKQYKEKSYIIGKEVDVYVGNECFVGTAVDIDENANLIVKDKKGVLRTFNSGEARVRRAGTSIT
jgi:BirA family biotin operon repressor/biotin-[acetyl-CoA-carboxylase] ligase